MYSISAPSTLPLLVALVLGVAAVAALLASRRNALANRFAAAVAVCVTLSVIDFLLLWTGVAARHPHVLGFSWPLWYLIGPLYYLQAGALTGAQLRPWRNQLFHLLPFAIDLFATVAFYISSAEYKLEFVSSFFDPAQSQLRLTTLLWLQARLLHLGLYVYLVTYRVRAFSAEYRKSGSSDEILNLELLRWVTIPFLAYIAAASVEFVWAYAAGPPTQWIDYFAILILSAFMVAMSAVSLMQGSVALVPAVANGGKYRKSGLTPEEAAEHVARLERMMREDKPFLAGNLRLEELASRLDLSPQRLSQVLNQALETNFFEFVNAYRVEHAQTLLTDPERSQHTVLAVAQDSGFSSPATFNRIFKKVTGVTPSEYRRDVARGQQRRVAE